MASTTTAAGELGGAAGNRNGARRRTPVLLSSMAAEMGHSNLSTAVALRCARLQSCLHCDAIWCADGALGVGGGAAMECSEPAAELQWKCKSPAAELQWSARSRWRSCKSPAMELQWSARRRLPRTASQRLPTAQCSIIGCSMQRRPWLMQLCRQLFGEPVSQVATARLESSLLPRPATVTRLQGEERLGQAWCCKRAAAS